MLRTERLVLRQWTDADRESFAAMGQSAEVMRHFPALISREQSDAFVDRATAHLDDHGWGLWAVEHAGDFVGFTGLAVPRFEAPFLPGTEIGWRFAAQAWGNGFATEAARAALAYAFDELELVEVLSFTTVANERSQAVMQRIGMQYALDFDNPNVPEGHPQRPHVLYRATRQ